MIFVGKTNIGKKRAKNEDSIFVSDAAIGSLPNLCIVADGMGGHRGGEVASSKSIDYFCGYVREKSCPDAEPLDFLIAAASYANQAVYQLSMADVSLHGMGTTFTAGVIKDGRLYVVHIGDSRLYSLSGRVLRQQTTDHTYVNEMIKAGQLTPESARNHPKRNLMTRALGADKSASADGLVLDVGGMDMVLMCSDGLTGMLLDEDIAEILNRDMEPEKKANELIDTANARGGHDNISVVLIDFSTYNAANTNEVMV